MSAPRLASVTRWPALAALIILLLAPMFLVALTAGAQTPTATARFVHGVAGAGPLDIYVNDALALIGIGYGETSSELRFPAGENALAVVPTGRPSEDALASGTIELRDGEAYYAALLGTVDAASVGLFALDLRPLDQGQARFRLINGVPDALPFVPAFTGGEALSEPLGYGDASEYATLSAGTYDLDLLDAETGTLLLSLPATEFSEGTTTDILVIGQVADGSLASLLLPVPVEVSRPRGLAAWIVPGDCENVGEPIVELGPVLIGQGDTVGVPEGPPVSQGFGLANVAFGALVAAPHSIVVADSERNPANYEACGAIGGQLTETGALVIALQAGRRSGGTGVAVLAPSLENPEATGVSIFLVGTGSDLPEATPASE
jgi:hypothetical protein